MSPSVKNQASIVAGRRQEEHPKPTTPYPDPRGAMETPLNTPGGSGSLAPQTRENAQDEIDKSRPHRVSALKQAWRFFSGKSSPEPSVLRTKPKYERDSDGWYTIYLTSPTSKGRYRALQPSPYPEDRRGKATRLDESQIQSYWNTPFQPERQAPPASHSTRQSFANDHEPEDIEIVAWNPGPRRSVHIVHDDPRQAVRSQVALVVDPSTEDFSSGSDSESSVTSACDSCSVPTTHSQDETYGEDEEEDIVMQARRATRVGRATLVTFPELNRNQNEDVQERRPPSVDLADCSVKWDDAQRLA
ncbi:hypothetical protein FVEN_g11105 [Fusarium venenatum]|uniref:uncharacterized protein n=1 Tax=Fusarium venenatum TaxID=56646 RepID=UPI001DA5AD5A|nr:hypothetical protein FVEN_g11105 [Fusarium venenatum]KAH7005994.1 hypothetical protein EDB82DRAFT_492132 [Fusarium venenatum]